MEKNLYMSERLNGNDTVTLSYEKPRPLYRTRVSCYASDNVNELGELMFEEENQIVLGGAIYVLEKIFGVSSPLNIDYLNNIMGIANTGPNVTEKYSKDNVVCLFGVGTGGSGDAGPVKDIAFQEREIFEMVPFRVTDQPLSTNDREKYWFKKQLTEGPGKNHTAYYLKTFENTPKIKVLWRDGEGGEDGTEVESGVHNTQRKEPIETFVEMTLKIGKNDIKEWFDLNGKIEQARINSLGLFTGIKSPVGSGIEKDYKQVMLFSKINFHNEMLASSKELTIIYRIYTS